MQRELSMDSLILLPSRNLWVPSKLSNVEIRALYDANRWNVSQNIRLPAYLRGDAASGDTLAVFGPAGNQPPATNYAALFVRNGHLVLAFDTTTQQTAIFSGIMPRNYTVGANITVYAAWMAATAVTGTIGWGITLERMNAANHDLDADAFATEQTITAATVDATSGKVTVTSVAITFGSTGTDSIAPGDPFRLRVRRDVANDTAAGDAHLISIEIKET
jgi:hypothetical protein